MRFTLYIMYTTKWRTCEYTWSERGGVYCSIVMILITSITTISVCLRRGKVCGAAGWRERVRDVGGRPRTLY